MSDQLLEDLMRRYFNGTVTPQEEEELMQLLADSKNEDALKAVMDDVWQETRNIPPVYTEEQSQKLLHEIISVKHISGRNRKIWWGSAAAAVLLLILAGGRWLIHPDNKQQLLGQKSGNVSDIAPGGNKATLTLANGNVIVLEDAQNGALSKQGTVTVIKLKSGQLAYNNGHESASGEPAAMNTLSTPRGGQYQVTLPDGTIVWLNSASSITFPTAFTGKTRQVQLKGEAYFEVATNAQQPFMVKVNKMEVQVLGTSFNLMAYADEQAIKTTLVDGAVKVKQENKDVVLKPGQQAQLDDNGDMKVVKADLDATIAWKNGLFTFNDATIEDVMRQLGRWYDMEIVYPEGIPQDHFRGEMFRNENMSSVLKILEASGVNLNVQGRKIIVKP
ncbi:FecR family protein [Chitinophaga sp. CF118]|uniref:FecR family protein n=1 Tax=Chitinophaga sp. CF118 TaxID=1884367 RepID=UPI0008E222DC|nr:FecR family protein [Chitinophaga sp. CF118]SFE34198.1 FecR family protein [Chitinophaga sp. CF118]